MFFGVIGLVGLFQVYITPAKLATLFNGQLLTDTLKGSLLGAASAGNPVVSYIIGGELLAHGISLSAITAFILSWVTLGFIQLPAEVAIFGRHFTLYRNILAFLFIIIITALTTVTLQVIT